MTDAQIDGRFRAIEHALLFVMNAIKVSTQHASGITDASGRPLPGVVVEQTLLDIYKQAAAVNQAQQQAAEANAMADVSKPIALES